MSADARRPALVVATWNVHGGVGSDRRYHPARIAQVLEEIRPDVIALQEVGSRASGENLLAVLVRETGFNAIDGWTCTRRGSDFGNAVLSRYPIESSTQMNLSLPRCEPRGALDVVLATPGGPLRVIATHLGLRPSERRAQVKLLLAALEREQPLPTVLTGDVNEWYLWGRPLRWLHRHFKETPAPATFPAARPMFALDRLWTEPAQLLADLRVHRSPLARVASDHLPLVAHLALPARGPLPHAEPPGAASIPQEGS